MIQDAGKKEREGGPLALPEPRRKGGVSFEEAARARRSVRAFAGDPIPIAALSQLLWAAQGTTGPEGERTVPSAGATYPLTVRVFAGAVERLSAGVYRYEPAPHALRLVRQGDLRREVATLSAGQEWIAGAPAVFLISADYDRTTNRYGGRGSRYVLMEAGHAAQNVQLQAVALGLGACAVGAFEDRQLQEMIDLAESEEPLYVIPVGKIA